MLKDLITADRIKVVKSVSNWEEAIKLAASPLVDDGSITLEYVDAMIETIRKYGPYVVLSPGIALPHARHEYGVNRLAMSLLKVEERVYFTEDKYANLFFILAACDCTSHIEALKQMAEIFSDDTSLERFLNARDEFEIAELIGSYK